MDADKSAIQDQRKDLYVKLGRRALPGALLIGLASWFIANRLYPVSFEVNSLISVVLGGPLPGQLRDVLSFTRHYGIPGALIALLIASVFFPEKISWLIPVESLCGQGAIRLVDVFSRLGEYLFHHRRMSQAIAWMCGLVALASLVKAYGQNQSDSHMSDLMVTLNDEMIDLVGSSVLHYRNRQTFDPVKDSMKAMSKWDASLARETLATKSPMACLYGTLAYVHEGTADSWSRISREIADLDESVPIGLASSCKAWKDYREGVPVGDGLYRDSFAGLTLAVARINDRLSLEGTSGARILKAARLYLEAKQLYATVLPERIAIQADNGLGNYFSACFARWPALTCDKVKENLNDLVCGSLENCYEKAERYYLGSGGQVSRVSDQYRRENNTFDLTMKALIRFSPPQRLPPYIKSTLIIDGRRVDSPERWLDKSIEHLESRTTESQVAPELYVTLSQLYAVRMAFLRKGADEGSRLKLARNSVAYLEISQRLLALDRDYFLFDVGRRGWCELIQALSVSSLARQEVRQRFLSVVDSFSPGGATEWLSESCVDCRLPVKQD